MKKIFKCLFLLVVIVMVSGCDEQPPTKTSIEKWMKENINDNYKIVSKNVNGNGHNKKIEYLVESEYGFTFSVTASMYYHEEYSFGAINNGYKRSYSTDYGDKIREYLQKDIKNIENEYKNYITKPIYSDTTYYFRVNNYNELSKFNDFAYKMYGIYNLKKINMSYKIGTNVEILLEIKNYNKRQEVYSDNVLNNKQKHLKELQYYYIYEAQLNKIVDDTIPDMKPVSLNTIYLNDQKLTDVDKNNIVYQWKNDTYVMPYYGFSYDKLVNQYISPLDTDKYEYYNGDYYYFKSSLLSDVVDKLGGTRKIKDNLKRNVINYTIGTNKYQIIYNKSTKKYTFKKNSKKIDIKTMKQPLYYPLYKDDDSRIIKVEDFAKLINCYYEIHADGLYFYSY